MSNVSRSVYQKLKEENKRLLADIQILSMETSAPFEAITNKAAYEVRTKWRNKFKEEREMNLIIQQACKNYMKNNPNDPAVKFVNSLKP